MKEQIKDFSKKKLDSISGLNLQGAPLKLNAVFAGLRVAPILDLAVGSTWTIVRDEPIPAIVYGVTSLMLQGFYYRCRELVDHLKYEHLMNELEKIIDEASLRKSD